MRSGPGPPAAGTLDGVLRVLLTPRWVGWTLLAVVVVGGCGGMAYWQLARAESPTGSLLNAGYAFQWPLFGVFFAVLWWRMLRQEAEVLAEIESGVEVVDAAADGAVPALATSPAGPSPFTARPAGVRAGDADGGAEPGSARAEYNAMLAALADADRTDEDEEHGRP